MHGLPPHIAQLICGHTTINTTMGYKAVYPEEAINGHRAFIARRRALRPVEEYRTPTDEEWDEFLGHFERRKLALGDCGRACGTSCIHEHAASGAPSSGLTPPSGRRLEASATACTPASPKPNTKAGPAKPKDSRSASPAPSTNSPRSTPLAARRATVHLGMPAFPDIAARTITTPGPASPAARIPS